jgi:hypothetical protein
MIFEFSRQISRKIFKRQISWKSVQGEPSCPMRTDRQADGGTDTTKLIFAFGNFANASKNETRFNFKVLATTKLFRLCPSLLCSTVNMKWNVTVILLSFFMETKLHLSYFRKNKHWHCEVWRAHSGTDKDLCFGTLRCINWQSVTYISEERSSPILVVKQPKKEARTDRQWKMRRYNFLKNGKKITSKHIITSRRLVCQSI